MPALTRTASVSSQMSDQIAVAEKSGGAGGTTTGQRALSGMKRFLGRGNRDKTAQRNDTARTAGHGNDDEDDEELLLPGLLDTIKPKAGRVLAASPASTTTLPSPAERSSATLIQPKQSLGHPTSINTPSNATQKPAGSLRKQTSYSSISNASTVNSTASTRSGGGLPRPRTASTASFTAPSSISSISTSQSRRISAAHRDLPTLGQRSRTTSVTSPAVNASFSASPNKKGSRVPVSSVSAWRLGSVQSIRGLDATPRPTATLGKAQGSVTSINDESPGLEVLVANTTLSMQDLQETLSPLTTAVSRVDRKDRHAQGSWVTVDHVNIENINTPSKTTQIATLAKPPRHVSRSSTASITSTSTRVSNSILPKSLTKEGLPLPPSRLLQTKNHHSPVPLQPKVASQAVPKGAVTHLRPRDTHPKVSSDIGDILDAVNEPDAPESPARYLAAESSTMAMREDLLVVTLTPVKPLAQPSGRSSELEGLRKELLEEAAREKLVYKAEMTDIISTMQLAMDKQERELSDLRAMLAKGAGTANRLAQLETEYSSYKRRDATTDRLKEQVHAHIQITAVQKQVFAQAVAASRWKQLHKDYAAELRELELQKDTLILLKDMVSTAENQIRCALLA